MNLIDFITSPNWAIRIKKGSVKDVGMYRTALLVQTPFLPDTASWQQRAWHVINNVNSVPECPVCGNYTKFQKYGNYSKTCSVKCAAQSKDTQNKRQDTIVQKYGSLESFNESKKEAFRKSSIEKYGVDNPFQSEEVKRKIKQTMTQRYGVTTPIANPEIRNKIRTTLLDRYGVEHALQSEELNRKMHTTMLDRYGKEHALQVEHTVQKIKQRNNDAFKRNHHAQRFISDNAMQMLQDKSFLIKAHHEDKRTLRDIANSLCVDKKTVTRYMIQHGIQLLRFSNSMPERDICNFLDNIGVSYRTNDRSVIPPYELDIYVPDFNLAIEYCGLYWHSELRKDKKYHSNKMQHCNKIGCRLITIFEDEWIDNKDILLSKLAYILGVKSRSDSVFARKCHIRELSSREKKAFLNTYHIQGNGPSSKDLGLVHSGELVACLSLIENSNGSSIISRYATKHSVVGGFSKLLKYYEKHNGYPEIITFADLRYSEGSLYEATGFEALETIPEDYYWCKDKKRWHKFSWRHDNKLKKLPYYDSSKSESENMHAHGFYKIWDCGKIKYVKNKKGP